jgi:hypothetical protein
MTTRPKDTVLNIFVCVPVPFRLLGKMDNDSPCAGKQVISNKDANSRAAKFDACNLLFLSY